MARLMVSISGVRGVYGDGLDDALAEKFAYAFGTLYTGSVVVGRDSRVSGPAIAKAVFSGLRKAGCDVIDLGLASTPTTEMAVTAKAASGGIIITASHNPGQWNGLKFLGPEGIFLDGTQAAEFIKEYEALGDVSGLELSGDLSVWGAADSHHVDAVLALEYVDSALIKSKEFTVCLDTVNGAGGPIMTRILESLGCKLHIMNADPSGIFTHNPEPTPAHLTDLCDFVREKKADIGIAVDPDVDRIALVDENGVAISEEYSLAFVIDYMMARKGCDAAVNLSSSRMSDDAAARNGCTLKRSAIGEINVVVLMREINAGIGGEGNGGIILPDLHYGRDAILGAAMILQILSEKEKTVSELAAEFPNYAMIKEKAELGEGDWRDAVREEFKGDSMDEVDGIKVLFDDSWVHVRESNTEPIVRLMAEAPDEAKARGLIERVRAVL